MEEEMEQPREEAVQEEEVSQSPFEEHIQGLQMQGEELAR